ncbi:uncharacterized protein LOC119080075 [Bradysia coprophila]|uniref:uncharacterized protein LOC119080075 n=1 Tax=Bradysia coprophila TaxID=38358 RepID=UPI00187D7E8A|nr:uncharacterized protein LOC119080075 [Bradysia coprophila]
MALWNLLPLLVVISTLTIVASFDTVFNLGTEISINSDDEELKCTKGSGAYCANDCATMLVCSGNNPVPVTSFVCPSPTQYCVENTCTSVPDASCPNGPGFTCTDAGIFPEPGDCRRSRVCAGPGGESRLYECPVGFVFNSRLNICQQGSTPCTRIDCSRATAVNPFIVYASNPAFYALCVNRGNGQIDTYMLKCPHEQFEIYDVSIRSCRFNCAARGNFQNPANCTEYFHCNGASTSTRPTTLSCPTDFVFDGTSCTSDPDGCKYPPAEDKEESSEELP